MEIQISRPHFPEGYMPNPQGFLEWTYVEDRMRNSLNYWIGTVNKSGIPHIIPVWGVWLDNRFYFDGDPKTRHIRNLLENPRVTVNLESGSQVVILHGSAKIIKAFGELGRQLAELYGQKYAGMGYEPEPSQWEQDGVVEVTPRKVLAWSDFTMDPTKFTLSF
jgi:nitroimidazol reductase NimA-like FMN-containing flavoprotein (pyridoxamine 5'-phosphate oxidase superfamily)